MMHMQCICIILFQSCMDLIPHQLVDQSEG